VTTTAIIPLPLSTAIESAQQRQVREQFFVFEHIWNRENYRYEHEMCGTCAIGGALVVTHPGIEDEADRLATLDTVELDALLPDITRRVPLDVVPHEVVRSYMYADDAHLCKSYREKGVEVGTVIMRLNDDACWTRQQIAAWLRTIGL
jgi:hypothetical protein